MKFFVLLILCAAAAMPSGSAVAETLQEQAKRLVNSCRTQDASGKVVDMVPGQEIRVGGYVKTCRKTNDGVVLETRPANYGN